MLKPSPPSEPKQIMISEYVLPEDQQFLRAINESIFLAVSRDGNQFAYSTTKGIYIRSMDELDARLIPGTDENAISLFFSITTITRALIIFREATRIISSNLPHIRIIGLSMHDKLDMANQMIAAGASAYCTKDGDTDLLLSAIRGEEDYDGD